MSVSSMRCTARQRAVTGSRPEGRLRTLGSAAGIAAPLLMWTIFLVAGLQRRGYNLLTDPASELGQAGTPGAGAFNAGFFLVPGLLIVTFAVRLYAVIARRRLGATAASLMGASGLSLVASGLITMNPNSSQLSLLHRLVGLPLLTALPTAILLLLVALPFESRWSIDRRLSAAAGSLMVLLIAAYEVPPVAMPDGILQRANLLVLTAWLLAVGLRLLRLPDGAGVAKPHDDSGYALPLGPETGRSPAAWLRPSPRSEPGAVWPAAPDAQALPARSASEPPARGSASQPTAPPRLRSARRRHRGGSGDAVLRRAR